MKNKYFTEEYEQMNKKQLEKLNKLGEEWVIKNGACSFDFENKGVNLTDGGLFALVEKTIMLQKTRGFKKLPNGCSEVLFTKKKYRTKIYEANIWFEDVDGIILYYKRMKKFLNDLGYNTGGKLKKSYVKKLLKQLDKVKK